MDADDADNSGDSDTTEGETNPEEGDASDETPDDNDTPVIDPADDVEEEPDVTAPVENEVPADAEDEAEAETTTAPGASVMATGDEMSFTVSYKVMKGDDVVLNAATVAFTNDCLGSGDTILDGQDITFTVTPAEDYVLAEGDAVTAKAGETELDVNKEDDTYTITNGSGDDAINDNVVITVNVVDKTYTVSAPADTESVTWKIKVSTATGYENGKSVEVKKGESVTVQATLVEGADPVDVTVNEETKSLTVTNSTAEFTVPLADVTAGADGSYAVTADYEAKKAEAVVTVTGNEAVLGTDFTAKYRISEGEGAFEEYKDVPTTGKIDAHADDEVSFKFTALNAGDQARTIKSVMFGGEDSTTPANDKTDEETGETIYTVTVAKPVAESANNIVTVELEETNIITIKKAADAKIKKVEYSTDNGSTYKTALVTTDGWKVETKEAAVTFKVTAETHNKVTYIHKGTEAHTAEACDNDMKITPGTEVTTTDSIDASKEGETLTIATEQITVEYTLTAPADKDVTVAIQKADGSAVAPKGTTEADANKYVLNDGETYYVKVDADLEKIDEVKIGTVRLPYLTAKEAFYFIAAEEDAGETITVALRAAQGYDVIVVMDNETEDYLATIQADAYEYLDEEDDEATIKQADADEEAKDIIDDEDGNPVTYANVLEDTDFSFVLAAKNTDNFKVTKVQFSTDGDTWADLEGENGKYTLEAVKALTTIKVTTDLDADKAYSIKFEDADGNIENVVVDYAGNTDPKTEVALDKINYLKKVDNAKVSFKIEPKTGYEVDKVTFGTGADDSLTASSGVYIYDKFSDDAKAAVITISTKAIPLTEDKFVRFNLGEDVTLNVTMPTGIKPDEEGVYKLTKEVKDDDKVTTAEISELAFDLTVPYGYTLDQSALDLLDAVRATTDKREKSEDGTSWVYSYKIVANQLEGTQEDPDEIRADASRENVTLRLAEGSERLQYKELLNGYGYGFSYLDPDSDETVEAGSTIILQVQPGQTLKVDGVDVTEELDTLNKYSFVAKLDDTKDGDSTIVIDVQDEASYKIYYDVDPKDDIASYDDLAGEEAVEAKIGSKVFVQLKKSTGSLQEISKYERSEGSKSTVKIAADQTGAEKGTAVITVADADVSVDLYTIETKYSGKIEVVTEKLAGTITLAAKDAAGKTLTAKGIKNNGTLKLDATTETSYALTLKDGKTTLDAGAYAEALLVSSSDETVANVVIGKDGMLYIETLKGDSATTDITISAKGAEETALLSFKVEGQTPKLKVKSVASNNQGMNEILVDVAADGSVKPVNDYFDLYYEVTVAQKEGSTSTTKKDGVYYLDAEKYDAKGKFTSVSQMFKVNADTPANAVENTYTFTVRLVAVAAGTSVAAGTPESGEAGTALTDANVKFASENMVKEFKTRPAYYEDKLSVTKKTTKFYSGQKDVVVAVPKFSKNAGYINDIKAVVYNKDGSLANSVTAGEVDLKTMEVKVSAGAYTAGSYDVVIYATAQTDTVEDSTEYSMYRASAKVPITVQKGINWIDVDYPSQIAQVADSKGVKKDVSVTLKTTGGYNYEYKNGTSVLAKAQTQKFTYALSGTSNQKNADKVVVKNNKITIKKDFIIGNDPADNSFTVRVRAADYTENDKFANVKITVNSEALEIASVKLVDENGKALPQTMTTREIEDARVLVTDKNGQMIDPDLVTLTPNKGKVYVDSDGEIVVTGYQKNLTVKAVTKDGGKKSASSVKYTINYPTGVTYNISDLNLSADRGAFHQTGDLSYTYMSKGNDSIGFDVVATVGDEEAEPADTASFNYSVKVVGGKVTSSKTFIANGYYSITPNKDTVTVTITDKTIKGDKGITYTFKDNNWQTAAAPKASTKDKLYSAKSADGTLIRQSMSYTVAKNNGYDAVKLTRTSGVYIYNASGVKDIEDNSFTLNNIYSSDVGTAKYSVVYGNKIDDTFYPRTKATTLSIKVNKTSTVKAVAKYTINPNVAMGVKLEAKPVPVEGMVQFNKVVSANVSGKANQFYDYFEVVDGMLQIKTAKRTTDGLAALTALSKNDLTGYLEYQYSNASGSIITKQDKITVTISDKALPKYAASAVNIVDTDNTSAKTTVKLGNDAVNISKVAAGDGASWSASLVGDEGESGIVTLTASGTPTSGNVDIFVIPEGSQNTTVTAPEDIRKLGVKVTVKVTVKAAADTKSKLSFAKGSATPDASINGSKVDLTVILEEGTDFTYNLSNEAVTAVAKTDAEGITNANDKKAAEAVNSVTFVKGADGAKDTITFVLDRDKLDGNKVYNVPADLTFSSTTKATVTFSVKTEKIPTMDDIVKLVGDTLKNYGVTTANYNNATAAAKEVENAANEIEIPALSGIQVSAVAAVDADKFGDSGSGDTAVAGDHKIKVTLTDVTKAADAEGKTADVEIVVTEKAAEKTLASALRAVITNYVVADADGTVPEGKVAIPTTKFALQAALQAAVDSVEANKYVVTVTSLDITRASAADGAEEGTITEITYTYTVKDAMTGRAVKEDVGTNSTVTTTGATSDIPGTSEPVVPNPPEEGEVKVQSVTITADKNEAAKGGVVTFNAVVIGSDNSTMTDIDADKVEWTVTGCSDTENTKIERDTNDPLKATLTLGENETGDSSTKKLTVTATVDNVASTPVEITVKDTTTETPTE